MRWRRYTGGGQRGMLVAWVSSTGECGRAVLPGAASGRANVSADTVSSWLFAMFWWWRGRWTVVGDGR